jgi:toxin-antitoxin system, antitoxin component, hicB family
VVITRTREVSPKVVRDALRAIERSRVTTLTVTANRWSGGWELEIDDDHHTQVRTLSHAQQQVIDYLDTVDEDTDHSSWQIDVVPDITSLAAVRTAHQAAADAKTAQARAVTTSRQAAAALRAEGLSVADAAAIMGVSPGRISQLLHS